MSANVSPGKDSAHPDEYAPEVLCAVPRRESRERLGIRNALPFRGEDLWNAWEPTWLNRAGKPEAATALFRVPADSANLIESRSLKLYLGSLAMSRFGSAGEVARRIAGDLSRVAGKRVTVNLAPLASAPARIASELPGDCIDGIDAACDAWHVDASLLRCQDQEIVDQKIVHQRIVDQEIVEETLHSHLLRSNCPVTGQPDIGSVLVRYRGPRIDRSSLLRYLVSYRRHTAFHENCVERMFVDIKARCAPERLTVYARYNRRGGIDINPFRSDFEDDAGNLRLWRQ